MKNDQKTEIKTNKYFFLGFGFRYATTDTYDVFRLGNKMIDVPNLFFLKFNFTIFVDKRTTFGVSIPTYRYKHSTVQKPFNECVAERE